MGRYFCGKNPFWFSVGNMFSAGVLLSAAIVHSLSDANGTEFYQSYKVPYANIICGVSFLLMLLLEEIGHSAHDSISHNHSHLVQESEYEEVSGGNMRNQGIKITPEYERKDDRRRSNSETHERYKYTPEEFHENFESDKHYGTL